MLAATRLPGIQFEVVAPPADETLVRMDIAVFVGFASSGPLHQAVAVEDITYFHEIFGTDVVLASDSDSNDPVYACLPSCVRAFFRNGGRRCWVIRVADVNQAESGQFPLPGLFRLESGGLTQALAPARSPGSWSDSLAASLSLRSHSLAAMSLDASSNTAILAVTTPGEIVPGDLLRFTFPGATSVFWLFVDVLKQVELSPPGNLGARLVSVNGAYSFWNGPGAGPSPGSPVICERITMDMFAENDDGATWSLTELGFAPSHPRYWGLLPTDAAFFEMETPDGLAAEAGHPRFPLAGPVVPVDQSAGYYLPAGDLLSSPLQPPSLSAGFSTLTGPRHSSATSLERDGLAAFGSSLFLDESLADSSYLDLLNEANYVHYQSPTPRNLNGIHAALEVDEATIIAVPDAVHRGWYRSDNEVLASPPFSSPLSHPERWSSAACLGGKVPPGSDLQGGFEPCDPPFIAAPVLTLTDLGGGRYSLTWTPLEGAVDSLEEALDADFVTAAVKNTTTTGNVTIYGQPQGSYFYRVRRQVGQVSSDYSNGAGIRIDSGTDWRQEPVAAYQNQTLLDIHYAVLRMSAARGDLFGVLSLPGHYYEREATAHANQLQTTLANEAVPLSFGGIYHPWLTGREENDLSELRTSPPDGAMAGVMAKRSLARGPWISPANENLSGVVALTPSILRTYRQLLQDAQVNQILQEPRGFLCLTALTLTDDADLAPINVRRLLSLLRKTAIIVGNQYVFEPLSDQFRRAVEGGFEDLLSFLEERGAFAGKSSDDSFQVVTTTQLNNATAADEGKFFIELRVAPSLPMRFLTVRLLQTADRTFVTEGQ